MTLLNERTRWLRERGSEQWNTGRDFETGIADSIDRQNTYLLRDGNDFIGTLTLTPKGDPDFWTPEELKNRALYVGKMASAVRRRGEGLGRLMLLWAQDWAARSGFDLLRWDVWRTNKQLQNYYRSIGGRYIRTIHPVHRWSGALFQIPASRITNLSADVVANSGPWPQLRMKRPITGTNTQTKSPTGGKNMNIRFLGKSSEHGDSPTLYATDRATYLVQGWKVTDPDLLATLDVPEDETVVEIYARLMNHLANDGNTGIVTRWIPPIVHVRENGNLTIQGKQVTDAEALAQMSILDHEDVVEVDKAAVEALLHEG
jgi:GNAT superfamily N-acetyltransferase